jgi:long-chain acyl-CoA synthetase
MPPSSSLRDQASAPALGLRERIERSVPSLLLERTWKQPDDVAFYEKHLGIYQPHTWARYRGAVEQVALGLRELKVKPGDRVAIMGDTCSEWLIADQAIMAAGAVTVGIYATSAPFEVHHVLNDSGANVVIVETQEHMDKLLEVLPTLPSIRNFIVIDTRALFRFAHPLYLSFEQLREMGAARAVKAPGEFATLVGAVQPGDLATILYTSGTTDKAKGVMVSHRTLLAAAESYVHCNPETRASPHRVVANMPLAHGVGRSVISHVPLISQITPFFGDEVESFAETVREVAPNFALLPPRYWEKFAAQLIVGVETSSFLKRRAYEIATRIGKQVIERRYAGQSVRPHLRAAYWLAQRLVFSQLLEKVGLGRMKIAFTGSAPMPPQVTQVWHIWGVDLREMYGLTECLAISIAQFVPFPRPGDIGRRPISTASSSN